MEDDKKVSSDTLDNEYFNKAISHMKINNPVEYSRSQRYGDYFMSLDLNSKVITKEDTSGEIIKADNIIKNYRYYDWSLEDLSEFDVKTLKSVYGEDFITRLK